MIYRKYFRNATRYFLVYLFLPLFFFLATALLDIVYSALLEIMPKLVPSYDRVLEKEEYQAFARTMSAIAALLAAFFASFFTGIYDNARYEDVITKTDGLYKVKDELPSYFRRTLPSDLIAVSIAPSVFVPLTVPVYSKTALEYFGPLIAPHLSLAAVFSPLGTYFMIFSVTLAARLLAMPKALDRYRSLWLTSFVDS
jgi:hypothetical protein